MASAQKMRSQVKLTGSIVPDPNKSEFFESVHVAMNNFHFSQIGSCHFDSLSSILRDPSTSFRLLDVSLQYIISATQNGQHSQSSAAVSDNGRRNGATWRDASRDAAPCYQLVFMVCRRVAQAMERKDGV